MKKWNLLSEMNRTRCKPRPRHWCSERCGVKTGWRASEQKRQQWRKSAIAACEQCGRNRVPEIRPADGAGSTNAEQDSGLKLNLHPARPCQHQHSAAAGLTRPTADRRKAAGCRRTIAMTARYPVYLIFCWDLAFCVLRQPRSPPLPRATGAFWRRG